MWRLDRLVRSLPDLVQIIADPKTAWLDPGAHSSRAGGRKPKLDAKQILHIKALLRDPNTNVTEVTRDYGVSRTTIYKHYAVVQPQYQ